MVPTFSLVKMASVGVGRRSNEDDGSERPRQTMKRRLSWRTTLADGRTNQVHLRMRPPTAVLVGDARSLVHDCHFGDRESTLNGTLRQYASRWMTLRNAQPTSPFAIVLDSL